MTEPAVVVDNVSKTYRLYHERAQSVKAAFVRGQRSRYEEFWALRDVSFEVPTGKTFGLIGANGSGKSTLLKCIARILRPNHGSITTNGKIAALLELGSGFHPELSGRENVFLNGSILGLSRKQLTAKFDEIVGFAGLEKFIDQPVKNYSSGMYVRLGFSVAINVEPDILVVDEVLAVGDAAFQRKCYEKFSDFRRDGRTVVVVSHAAGTVRQLCDQVAWLESGSLRAVGPAAPIVDEYMDQGHVDRVAAPGGIAGSSRYGSGEVRFTSIELLGPDGQPTQRVRTGDPVTIRLSYQASEPIPNPVWGLGLETLEGVNVWGHNTKDAQWGPNEVTGEGCVELFIGRLMLQPGTFDLTAGIFADDCVHSYDFIRRCLRFDVDHGEPRETGGIVALGGVWRYPALAPVDVRDVAHGGAP